MRCGMMIYPPKNLGEVARRLKVSKRQGLTARQPARHLGEVASGLGEMSATCRNTLTSIRAGTSRLEADFRRNHLLPNLLWNRGADPLSARQGVIRIMGVSGGANTNIILWSAILSSLYRKNSDDKTPGSQTGLHHRKTRCSFSQV